MTWKYLIIAITELEHRKVNLQFEVAADTIAGAAKEAKDFMEPFFYIDILEIRRL